MVLLGCNRCFGTCGAWFGSDHGCAAKASDIDLRKHIREIVVGGGICRPEWGSRVAICYSYLYRDVGPNGPEAISNSRASILSSSKPHSDSVFNEALTMLRPKRDSVPPKTTDRPAACLRKALKSRPSSAGRTKTGALDFDSVTRGVGGREQDRRFEEF
jgi:hypothetical protein